MSEDAKILSSTIEKLKELFDKSSDRDLSRFKVKFQKSLAYSSEMALYCGLVLAFNLAVGVMNAFHYRNTGSSWALFGCAAGVFCAMITYYGAYLIFLLKEEVEDISLKVIEKEIKNRRGGQNEELDQEQNKNSD